MNPLKGDKAVEAFFKNHFACTIASNNKNVDRAIVVDYQNQLILEIKNQLQKTSLRNLIINAEKTMTTLWHARDFHSKKGLSSIKEASSHNVINVRSTASRFLIELYIANNYSNLHHDPDAFDYAMSLGVDLILVSEYLEWYDYVPGTKALHITDGWEIEASPHRPAEAILADIYSNYKHVETIKNANNEFIVEFGFQPKQIRNIIHKLSLLASGTANIWTGTKNELRNIINGIEEGNSELLINRLTLHSNKIASERLWRYRREHSLITKPFIALEEEQIIFGSSLLSHSWGSIQEQISTDRYKGAQTKQLRRWMSDSSNSIAQEIVLKTSKRFVRKGYYSQAEIWSFDSKDSLKNVNGEDWGDIDILIVDVSSKKIYVIEVKAWQMARQVSEIGSEAQKIVRENTEKKHLQRVKWVEDRTPQALDFLDIQSDHGSWTVEGIIVTTFPNSLKILLPNLALRSLSIYQLNQILDKENEPDRNGKCLCGSKKKYKKCCFKDI